MLRRRSPIIPLFSSAAAATASTTIIGTLFSSSPRVKNQKSAVSTSVAADENIIVDGDENCCSSQNRFVAPSPSIFSSATTSSSSSSSSSSCALLKNPKSIRSLNLDLSFTCLPLLDDKTNKNNTSIIISNGNNNDNNNHQQQQDGNQESKPSTNPDHHLNWNPFSNRVVSLKSLHSFGIGRDPNNEYRVCVRDKFLVAKWARKVLTESVKPKNSLKKWEKSMIPRLATGEKKKNNNNHHHDQSQTKKSKEVDELLESLMADPSLIDKITNDELVDRTQQFLDDAFSEATRGESNKLKRAAEPGALTFDELNEEQQNVLQLAAQGRNLFIGGTAGTGKTAMLRALHAHFVARLGLKVALCATTGVAGVHVGGATFHSTVGVPTGGSNPAWDIQTLRAADVLIVDEVSMLTSVLIEALDIAAREARLSSAPFGGLQVVLCGDFMQLIPQERLLFESATFRRNFVKVGLRTALRHTEGEFRDALLSLRVGKFHPAFKKCFVDRLPDPLTTEATFLFPRRASAQQVNDLRLEHIKMESPDDERTYLPQRGVISLCGNFSSACVVSLLPNNSSSSFRNNSNNNNILPQFHSKKICDQVEAMLNINTVNNNNNNTSSNADKESSSSDTPEQQAQPQQPPNASSTSSSGVFSMLSRSGLTPQVIFRLKHPIIGKPLVSEPQWRDAIQQVLAASFPTSHLTWHFDDGDCSDIVPVEIATALGVSSTSNGENNNNINAAVVSALANQNDNEGANGDKSEQQQQQQQQNRKSNNNNNQQQHQQAVRLRRGCRVMINRNLSRDVVNGSIGVVVRFEEPDQEKFPFAKNATLMRLWYQKGGKQAVQNYGMLPVVRLLNSSKSSIKSTSPSSSSATDNNDISESDQNNNHRKLTENEMNLQHEAETSSSPSSTSSTLTSADNDDDDDAGADEKNIENIVPGDQDSNNENDTIIEYQIPPMFVNVGGSEETAFYQQSSFYMPLQLGFSLTVHKCQGLTILGRVVLDLRELTYKAPHLVYVACSRVRSLDQLSIVGLNSYKHLIVDQKALEFSSSLLPVESVLATSLTSEEEKNVADWMVKKQNQNQKQ